MRSFIPLREIDEAELADLDVRGLLAFNRTKHVHLLF